MCKNSSVHPFCIKIEGLYVFLITNTNTEYCFLCSKVLKLYFQLAKLGRNYESAKFVCCCFRRFTRITIKYNSVFCMNLILLKILLVMYFSQSDWRSDRKFHYSVFSLWIFPSFLILCFACRFFAAYFLIKTNNTGLSRVYYCFFRDRFFNVVIMCSNKSMYNCCDKTYFWFSEFR